MAGTRGKGQPDRDIFNLFVTLNQQQENEKHDTNSLYEGRLRSHAQTFEGMKRKWEGVTGMSIPTKKLKTSEPDVHPAKKENGIVPNQHQSVAAAEWSQKPAAATKKVVKQAPMPKIPRHPEDKINVDNMIVNDLRKELKKRKLGTGGRKAELQARLREYLAEAKKGREAKWAAKYAVVETEETDMRIRQVRIGGNNGKVQEKVMDVVMEDASEADTGMVVGAVKKAPVANSKESQMESDPVMREVAKLTSEAAAKLVSKKQAPKSALKPSKYQNTAQIDEVKPATKPVPTSFAKEDLMAASKQTLPTKVSESSSELSVSKPSAKITNTQSSVQKTKISSTLAQTTLSGSAFKTPKVGAGTAKLLEKKKAHAAASEARKARLAEMRQKAKPTPGSASSAAKHPSSHSKYAASSTLKKMASSSALGECKSNSILAKMREKAGAEKNTENVVPNTKPRGAAVKPHQTGMTKASPMVKGVSQVTTVHSGLKPTALKSILDPANKPSPVPEIVKPVAMPEEKPLSPMQTYEMSDREEDSDSESDSDEEDERQRPKKAVPGWAQKANLHHALNLQFADGPDRLDPDQIFGECLTCNLEEIFEKKKSRYQRRTSSGCWTKDHVTIAEKLTYKRTMGYDK